MPPMCAENSVCSFWTVYQWKRVSEDEVEVFNTSVDVTDSQDGRRRRFSVRSWRASVKLTLSLAQVAEGSLSPTDTAFRPRCSLLTSIQLCSGLCDILGRDRRVALLCVFRHVSQSGLESDAGVLKLSIASCGYSQLTWESKKSSSTLVRQL